MINGTHLLLYSRDPQAGRDFFRGVLGFNSVDAGKGWLIFALPPAELGVHSGDGNFVGIMRTMNSWAARSIMCNDLHATIVPLQHKSAQTTASVQAGWEVTTTPPSARRRPRPLAASPCHRI